MKLNLNRIRLTEKNRKLLEAIMALAQAGVPANSKARKSLVAKLQLL